MTVQFAPLTANQLQKIRVSRKRAEPTFFLDKFFSVKVQSKTGTILIETLPEVGRRLAAFSSPLVPGKPITGKGSAIAALKPAYLKHTTPVDPSSQVVTAGDDFGLLSGDPALEHVRERLRITLEHNARIERTWEYMAAFATIHGYIDTEYEGAPQSRINFGRDAALTVTKTAGTYWGTAGVSIIDDIQTYKGLMSDAENGGRAKIMLVGTKVAALLVKEARKDGELHELLDTRYGVDSSFVRGLRDDEPVNYLGRLSGMIDVYEYDASYETIDNDGQRVTVRPLAANEIALIAQDFVGIRGFGRIEDLAANYAPVEIFGRNFIAEGSPQREVVDHQSAPIMIPAEPNKTLKATVMAA